MSTLDRTAIAVQNGGVASYRASVTSADGTAAPANNSALFVANPGDFGTARIYYTLTGTTPTATFRPYVRNGGATGIVGGLASVASSSLPLSGAFDVAANGDDVAVLVETLGGTTPAVALSISWR